MSNNKTEDRIKFLAKKFNVTHSSLELTKIELSKVPTNNYKLIEHDNKFLATIYFDTNTVNLKIKLIKLSQNIFNEIIDADPTFNKMYCQWMLNVFFKLLRNNTNESIQLAIRFIAEDLPQANTYLKIFEANKRKDKFKMLCQSSHILKNIKDPTDINQYESLSQLFDAVDPFIEKKPTELESLLLKYVNSNQAKIPVKDRKFLVFIPETLDASIIFGQFANWCTAKPNNGMFKRYTTENKQPNGQNSKIYIIINNNFFTGKSNEIYQIHFETSQIKDRHNEQNISIFENVITQSEAITNFFHDELISLVKMSKNKSNNYLDLLTKFGFCDALFDVIDEKTPTIRFMDTEMPKMPNLTKFNNLDQLIITGAKMVTIDPSIGNLKNLEILALTNNKIKAIPKEIGNLKKLLFLNIIGNPIKTIPEEIKYLDKSNGGSLFKIAVNQNDIGIENYNRLKLLLPTTKF